MISIRNEKFSFFATPPITWKYVSFMVAAALIPTVVMGVVLHYTVPALSDLSPKRVGAFNPIVDYIGGVLIAPILETLLMGPLFKICSFFSEKRATIAVMSTVLWALAHFLFTKLWFLIAWPFFIFSCVYLAWRPYGWGKAVRITILIHMLYNCVLMSSMAICRR